LTALTLYPLAFRIAETLSQLLSSAKAPGTSTMFLVVPGGSLSAADAGATNTAALNSKVVKSRFFIADFL
jgi:hypothetical protein